MILDMSEEKYIFKGTIIPSNETITQYGHIMLTKSSEDFKEHFSHGDLLLVRMATKVFIAPYVVTFTDVDCYQPEVLDINHFGTFLAVNFNDIATRFNLARKIVHKDHSYTWVSEYQEISFSVEILEKGAYLEKMKARTVGIYPTKREHYPNLNDEEYANFRACEKGRTGKGILFRTASPIDDLFGRADYADKAIREHQINNVINLSDNVSEVSNFPKFADSYYATTNRLEVCMGVEFHDQEFKDKIRQILEFIAVNEGKYAINCIEGKDRTGILIALLEAYMGYTLEEIEYDYMLSFYNYYGIKPGEVKYEAIKRNISIQLKYAFEVATLDDLEKLATNYFKNEIKVSDYILKQVKKNLARS